MKNHINTFEGFLNEARLNESKPAMMYYVVAKDVIKDRRLKVYPENIERLLNNLQADGHLSYDATITSDAKKDIENALDKLDLKGNELLSYARKGMKYESEDVNEANQIKVGTFVRYKKDEDFTGGKIKSISSGKAEIHNWDGSTTELPLKDLEYIESWNN